MSKEIDEHLKAVEDEILSEFGQDSVRRLSAPDNLSKIAFWVSSGSAVIDSVLAAGRQQPCSLVPFGRVMELSGPPGAGKTSTCAQIAAQTQQNGGIVVVVDTEERIAEDYWRSLGVDLDQVLNIRATSIEEVFEKQEKIIKIMMKKAPDRPLLLIWDSLGSCVSREIEEDDPKSTFMERAAKSYGRDAKSIGAGLKLLNPLIAKSRTCYLYTNHIYKKMGVAYGDDTETPGGNKIKFLATIRLRLTPAGAITETDKLGNKVRIGQKVKVKAVKNSMGPSLLEKEAVILGGQGFSDAYSLFDTGKKLGVITGKGAWSTAKMPSGEEVKFQGWNGFQEKVIMHPEFETLLEEFKEQL